MPVKLLFAMVCSLLLGGCVAQRLDAYVGRPIDEVVREFGMPAKVVDLDAQTRLFVWSLSADLHPGPPPLSTFAPVPPGGLRARMHVFEQGGLPGGACAYHLIGKWNAETRRWIVAKMLPPPIACT